jgi:raffinose/stachyose/melibiose transport system substrate-binding protein
VLILFFISTILIFKETMRMKSSVKFLTVTILVLSFIPVNLSAGGSGDSAGKGTMEIEVLNNSALEPLRNLMNEVVDKFIKETGVSISYNQVGSGYEELMKTRMASNDMPDVFTTHGWAVVRYGEFLLPLNDQPWFNNVVSGIKSVVTDNKGNLLVLPSSYMIFGINCNYDVLKAAGVDPAKILTWKDFEDACEKVKAIGKTPIAMGAKDSWLAAQFFQDVACSRLTKEDNVAIANGTFDWNKLTPICEQYADWVRRGFFNVDCLTADFNTSAQLLATDAAFHFCDTSVISQAWTYYPNANLGVIPVPVDSSVKSPINVGGEYLSWGIWKNSSKIDSAKKFLSLLARPENTKAFAEATMSPAGLDNTAYDLGRLTNDMKKLASLETIPIWDRTLPSGMFNDLCTAGQSLLAKEPDAVSKSVNNMRNSYNEKMKK